MNVTEWGKFEKLKEEINLITENSFIDINFIKLENFLENSVKFLPKEVTWKKYTRVWGNKLHQICSYTAMFPPRLANWFIKKIFRRGRYSFRYFFW